MANLTLIIQTTKKIGTALLVVTIIALLLGVIYFRFTKKTQAPPAPISTPSIHQYPTQKAPASLDVSPIPTKDLKFPEELPVFAATSYQITDAAAKTLAKNLGFGQDPTRVEEETLEGKLYIWDLPNQRLTLSQTTILYRNNPSAKPNTLPLDKLQEQAVAILQKISPVGSDLKLNEAKTKYLIDIKGRLTSAGLLETAQLVEFSFDKKLSGLELVDNAPDSTYTTVRVRKDGEVIYLASRFFDQFTEQGTYQIKTAKEAVEEIKKGQGKVVQTQIPDQYGQALELFRNQPENVASATITSLRLAYFLPDEISEPIQPIFVAEGTFQKEKEQGRIVIYLPAVKGLVNPKP